MAPHLDYQSAARGRRFGRTGAAVAAVVFGAWGAVLVYFALRWTREMEGYTAHADGFRISIRLAWIAATLLIVASVAAAARAVIGSRQ